MSTTTDLPKQRAPRRHLQINGELVILGADGRLSFDALQQRLVTAPGRARAKAAELPAAYAAFDVLAAGGIDLRGQRGTTRRGRLEQIAGRWTPPLQVTPVTDDIDEARDWFELLPAEMGIEGLVCKGAASRYLPGRRDAWVKVNSLGVGSARPRRRGCLVPGQVAGVGWVAVRDRCRGPAVVV